MRTHTSMGSSCLLLLLRPARRTPTTTATRASAAGGKDIGSLTATPRRTCRASPSARTLHDYSVLTRTAHTLTPPPLAMKRAMEEPPPTPWLVNTRAKRPRRELVGAQVGPTLPMLLPEARQM